MYEERDPELLLSRLQEEEQLAKRGRLKIFFGAMAGVGKTYSMLESARALQRSGLDVVIGVVETHGRKDTEALLAGFEILPLKKIDYRGTTVSELDLDAALSRKPELILVDELAHTNAPSSRHPKRWQDVEELLNEGIDVYTTLNVQHVESLNDVVQQITKIPIRERVPDSFIERAHEIELVDLTPDELIERLKKGKVYFPEQASKALENFFRRGNLIALRELALRVTAERVDAQMDQYRQVHRIHDPWPASDRILVCVSPSPLSIKLVRAAKRMATRMRSEWIVAYVERPSEKQLSGSEADRILQTLRLAEQLGAETIRLTGARVSEELIRYARQSNVAKIIIGKPLRPRWQEIVFGSVVDELIRQSGIIDVYVISGDETPSSSNYSGRFKSSSRFSDYMAAMVIVAIATVVARLMFGFFELSNVAMVYMLGVVITATRYRRGPAIAASIVSVAAFDFFFVPPVLTFAVTDTQYVVTFLVMLTVALVISTLTAQVKQQAENARIRERRTASLYSLSRHLSSTAEFDDLIETGLNQIADEFESSTAILFPNDTGKVTTHASSRSKRSLADPDEGVAQWSFKNGQIAGLGTNTLHSAKAIYVPLKGAEQIIGVVALRPDNAEKFQNPEQLHLLETFVNQMAIACERAFLTQENERNHVQIKTEQLRNSLLSSVSHDLRTPLATITGAASSIIEGSEELDLQSCKEMAAEIYHEAERLNRLVKNLLDMTRIQEGNLVITKEPYPADELIGSALSAVEPQLGAREVRIKIDAANPEDLCVPVDPVLFQQVLVNLLENAIKYTPEKSPIDIEAKRSVDGFFHLIVSDRGPGISDKNKDMIFKKFYRGDPQNVSGSGLGLAICTGIIEAHNGRIWVENRDGGGASFHCQLPSYDSLNPKDNQLPKITNTGAMGT